MNGIIYIHSNKINGRCYVGQTTSPFNVRNNAHRSDAERGNHLPFHGALRKHGWDGFDHQIVASGLTTQEELNNLECLWMMVLNTRHPACGYNLKEGGHKGPPTVEARQNISRKLMGHPVSEATRAKLSMKLCLFFRNKENRAKQQKRLTVYLTPEEKHAARLATQRRYRDKKRGKPPLQGEARIRHFSEKRMGHIVTQETREKIRAALSGKQWSSKRRATEYLKKARKCA